MKKALVVVAHGSRREASNDEVRALASRLADMPDTGYDSVTAAFLELAEPLIPDGVVDAVDDGAGEVVVPGVQVLGDQRGEARVPGGQQERDRLSDLGVSVIGIWDRGKFQYATPDTLIGPNTILVLAGSVTLTNALGTASAAVCWVFFYDRLFDRLAEAFEQGVQRLRLGDVSREAIQDETARRVVLGQAFFQQAQHDVVGHQFAPVHHRLGLFAQLGTGGDGTTQNVSGGNLY